MSASSELSRLIDELASIGVSHDTLGDLAADIGDMQEALNIVVGSLRLIAARQGVANAIAELESEIEDHMPGHLDSLRTLPSRLRNELGVPD